MLNLVRALWLCSALVPGFAAAVLYQTARLRFMFCASAGGGDIPSALNQWRHILPSMSALDHFTGAAIFLPVMAIALFVPANRLWYAVGGAVVWMVAVLVHLGLQIPQTCPIDPPRQEALALYIWPAALGAMIIFRLNTAREAAKNREAAKAAEARETAGTPDA